MNLSDRLWNTIFHPDLAMRQLSAEKPWGQSLILYVVILTFMMIINQGSIDLRPIEEALRLPAQFVWLFGLAGIIFSLLILFLSAGFFSLLSEIIYKHGNSLGLLAALCFSLLPGLFGSVLQYGSTIIGLDWLGAMFSSLSMIWVMVLQVIAVRAALDLSTGQALVIYFAPLLMLVFAVILFITLIFVSALSLL